MACEGLRNVCLFQSLVCERRGGGRIAGGEPLVAARGEVEEGCGGKAEDGEGGSQR